jgi:hypothetical protein
LSEVTPPAVGFLPLSFGGAFLKLLKSLHLTYGFSFPVVGFLTCTRPPEIPIGPLVKHLQGSFAAKQYKNLALSIDN